MDNDFDQKLLRIFVESLFVPQSFDVGFSLNDQLPRNSRYIYMFIHLLLSLLCQTLVLLHTNPVISMTVHHLSSLMSVPKRALRNG